MCSPALDHFQLVNVLAQVGSQEKCRIDVAVSPDTILGCDEQKLGIGMIWQHFYLNEYEISNLSIT